MPGIIYALIASVIWGVNYAIAEQTYKYISIYTSLSIEMLIGSIVCMLIGNNLIVTDVKAVMSNNKLLGLVIISCLLFNAAMIMIARSIQVSNATVAGLIEICYPLFTILATLIIFNKHHLSLPVIIGGLLILAGVLVITIYSK